MINLEFRHPRHLQVGLGVGMAMFGIVGGVTLLVGILALFGIVAPEVSAPEGFFILLALGAFIGLSMWSNKIIRRVEEEDQQATIAFIQRMFEAELIEPHLVSGAANVR